MPSPPPVSFFEASATEKSCPTWYSSTVSGRITRNSVINMIQSGCGSISGGTSLGKTDCATSQLKFFVSIITQKGTSTSLVLTSPVNESWPKWNLNEERVPVCDVRVMTLQLHGQKMREQNLTSAAPAAPIRRTIALFYESRFTCLYELPSSAWLKKIRWLRELKSRKTHSLTSILSQKYTEISTGVTLTKKPISWSVCSHKFSA